MSSSRAPANAGSKLPRHPRKRFGQHFLTDPSIIERIFAALRCQATDRVLEIGPGTGLLTERLCQEAGTVTAIEVDRDLAVNLQARATGPPGSLGPTSSPQTWNRFSARTALCASWATCPTTWLPR